MEFIPSEHQHRRYNPLLGEWVLVCPHRMRRPWSGAEEPAPDNETLKSNTSNPLWPGAVRSSGVKNDDYEGTFVFTNDFPALLDDSPQPSKCDDPLFRIDTANGTCKVMCFHPQSDITMPLMSDGHIIKIIHEWINQYNILGKIYRWVQIFENKGSSMGCSNPHPHCQIWACSYLPTLAATKDTHLRDYHRKYKAPMLNEYCLKELARKERVVIENPDWIVVVPFWASWPFETMIISRNNNKRLNDLTTSQVRNLGAVMKELTTKYDNLFQCSFPYSMGFHGAPTGPLADTADDHWTLHAIYYPPLLRSAQIRKFMVGFELLCEAQRDLTAEQAAERLRMVNGKEHYSIKTNKI